MTKRSNILWASLREINTITKSNHIFLQSIGLIKLSLKAYAQK